MNIDIGGKNKIFNAVLNIKELIWYGFGLLLLIFTPFVFVKMLFACYAILVKNKKELFAFGKIDAGFRVWYDKIAKDFYQYGRGGHSWDDGLGLTLGARAYNNWATYYLVRVLGQLKLAMLGYLLWSMVVIGFASYTDIYTFLLLSLLLPLSPLIVQMYTQLNKPELFWWFLVPFIAYFGFSEFALAAGLLWSVMAMVNAASAFLVAVSIMVSAFLAQIFIFDSFYLASMLILGSFPGAVKLLLRLINMWQSGYLNVIANEQKGLWNRGFFDLSDEFVTYSIFMLSIWCSVANLGYSWVLFIIIGFPALAIYYMNWRFIYLNDKQSFLMLYVVYSLGLSYFSNSFGGFVFGSILTLNSIWIPTGQIGKLRGTKLVVSILSDIVKTYPYQKIINIDLCNADPLAKSFDVIPENSRILFVLSDRLRSSRYRPWIEMARFKLVEKRISLINDIYGGMQTDKLDSVAMSVSGDDKMDSSIKECLTLLSIDYVITVEETSFLNISRNNMFSLLHLSDGYSQFFNGMTKVGVFQYQTESSVSVKGALLHSVSPIIESDHVIFDVAAKGRHVIPYIYNDNIYLNDDQGRQLEIESVNISALGDLEFCMVDFWNPGTYTLNSKKRLWPTI